MEWQGLPSTDAVFVFDADVIPYRFHVGLEKWAGPFRETVVFYVRAWSNEIMAGSYMVRNTVAGRDYLRGWGKFIFVVVVGNCCDFLVTVYTADLLLWFGWPLLESLFVFFMADRLALFLQPQSQV